MNTRKRNYTYNDASNSSHGIMSCFACGKPIREGRYRTHETAQAYVNCHEKCCLDDPTWVQLNQARTMHLAKREACRRFISEHKIDDLSEYLSDDEIADALSVAPLLAAQPEGFTVAKNPIVPERIADLLRANNFYVQEFDFEEEGKFHYVRLEDFVRMVDSIRATHPNCGACPGDGTVCVDACRVEGESPPFRHGIDKALAERAHAAMDFGEAIDPNAPHNRWRNRNV